MTDTRAPQWWRLMNPIYTLFPPAIGSQPEVVISVPPVEPLLINDDWQESAQHARIAIGTTDGTRRETLELVARDRLDADYLVFLAHPSRLWVRTLARPTIGSWVADQPAAAVHRTEQRVGQKIRKGRRR